MRVKKGVKKDPLRTPFLGLPRDPCQDSTFWWFWRIKIVDGIYCTNKLIMFITIKFIDRIYSFSLRSFFKSLGPPVPEALPGLKSK